MAKAINTFLRSKMNKDLDARLIPNGEYRNAVNVQISKSEGDGVGTVENVLGNTLIFDFESITGVSNLYCIGYLSNDFSNTAFVFLTDNTTASYKETGVGSNHFVFACNPDAFQPVLLLTGPFLNLCQLNPIYGINLLEDLLFWTDDRNQPRKININLANPEEGISTATYYTTEDQISVAKYNPYDCMELFQKSYLSSVDGEYESTMKDVSSLFLPNGGKGDVAAAQAAGLTTTTLVSFIGDIQVTSGLYLTGANLGVINSITGVIETPASLVGATVDTASFDSGTNEWTINIIGGTFPALIQTDPSTGKTYNKVVLNPNPYYNPNFPGDDDYLEDKFVRFSYRFKFEDNEYSVFAPFTQIAFIPKQDGYFMYVKESAPSLGVKTYDDQADAYRSTVVYFVENKVDDITLKIPLPFNNFDIQNSLKITEVDILYKEAQDLAVKVVDTIPVSDINNSAGFFTVTNNSTVGGVSEFTVSNIQGGIPVGGLVTGFGITGKPKVTEFIPTNPNNPSTGGTVKIDLNETGVSSSTVLQVNDVTYFDYNYQSKKPFKTLPSVDLTRVYDKTPVKAFSQEVAGNRVIYANYQDKHTPPEFLNYNVSVSNKGGFNLNRRETSTSGGTQSGTTLSLSTASPFVIPQVGDFITIISGIKAAIPEGTQVVSVFAPDPALSIQVTLSNSVTNVVASDLLLFQPGGDTENTTSIVEYPNSTLKQNRNYQVGIVLSDRYSRTSSVILSSNKSVVNVGTQAFSGSTIYSAYLDESTVMSSWPGNSLKLLFNEIIDSVKNPVTGTPGLYNGDPTSADYNPLGWYSYKIVVKQTEQEYYNVYLPGIMAAYPEDTTLEIGSTSHAVLINDNINKVPRDLSEVGPEQRQFRSSVQLFGRVENTNIVIDPAGSSNLGAANKPYYPGRESDTVSTISTIADMFDYSPLLNKVPSPNYFPQFYSSESNPLIARISTESKIGQIATTNYNTVSALIAESATTNLLKIKDVSGNASSIAPGDSVLGSFSSEIVVGPNGYTQGGLVISTTTTVASQSDVITVASIVGVAPGNLAIATGIPGGTSVVGVSGSNVTLSNVVNIGGASPVEFFEADTLELSAAVSVDLNENIVVQPQANPGLQYLAVYETEPTESLLDIFWETSSSGLISDLNNAILNDSSGGAALSSINTSVFDEAIAVGGNISTAPFSILDNFGSPVLFADITSELDLVSAFNALDESVIDYFTLVPAGVGVNSYNIQVTQTYFDNIYFGENNTSSGINRRTFTLNLTASINDLESNFTINLNLANVPPSISAPTPNQQISKNTTDEIVATVIAVNGAAANVQPNDFNVDFALNSCEITAVTNSAGENVLPLNYFRIPQQGSIFNNTRRWAVFNNLFDQNPLIPIDTYNITARVKDAGGIQDSVSVSFSIDYGVSVRNVSQLTWREQYIRKTADFTGFGSSVADIWVQDIVVFEVYAGAGINQQGWYLYNGAWSSETTADNFTLFTTVFGSAVGDPQNFSFTSTWPTQIPTNDTGPNPKIISGPSVIPLIGSNTTTFASENQVSIDFSGANQPINASTVGTLQGGEAFLMFEPTSGAAGRTAIIDAWKTNRSAQQILKIQFPSAGLYSNSFNGSYWVNQGSDTIGQFVRTLDIDDNYNISSFSWTIPS